MKAATLSTACPYTSAKFWPQNWDAFPGCDPRAKAEGVPSTEMRCGQAGHLSQEEHPSTGIAALLLSCQSLIVCIVFLLFPCEMSFIFVLPLDAFQNLAEGGSQILMTAMEVRMLLLSLLSSSKVGPHVSRRVNLRVMCDYVARLLS